jgi:hypothetical protein
MAQISFPSCSFSAPVSFFGALAAGGVALGFEPAGGIVTEMDFTLGKTDYVQAKRPMFAIDRLRAPECARLASVPWSPTAFTNTAASCRQIKRP